MHVYGSVCVCGILVCNHRRRTVVESNAVIMTVLHSSIAPHEIYMHGYCAVAPLCTVCHSMSMRSRICVAT